MAVLKRTKLKLADKDIYVNVVGGLKINDQRLLAVAMAIASANARRGIWMKSAVVFGELVWVARFARRRVTS